MNVYSALILFFGFIVMYTIVIEVFTVLFRLTGLTREKANFQVVSMLTTCGFTTNESELIASSPLRRRLAKITILFGYSFNVIIVSILINLFLALSNSEIKSMVIAGPSILLLLLAFFLFTRLNGVKAMFSHVIEKMGKRIMFGKSANPIVVIDTFSSRVLAEVQITTLPNFLENTPLSKAGLKENHSIQIIMVKRVNSEPQTPSGDTIIGSGDTLVLFGNYNDIKRVFEHPID